MHGTSTLQVDLDAIARNVGQLRAICAPGVRFCAVLKADAYGLGARGVMSTLKQAGSSMFAVFSPGEACELSGIDLPLLVLMPVMAGDVPGELLGKAAHGSLHFVVHESAQLESLDSLGRRLNVRLPVHLKIDTGLHRGGCEPRDAVIIARSINRSQGLRLAGVMTHFAQAASNESFTSNQMRQLDAVVEHVSQELSSDVIVHASGTCGALRGSEYHADMIRIGLAWSGHLTPSATGLERHLLRPLEPAVSWSSRLVLTRTIGEGEQVGYGGDWIAQRPTRMGLVPVGYANGYPLNAARPDDGGPGLSVEFETGNGADVATAPVIGRVSMDQFMVDLTDVSDEIQQGAPVTLISRRPGSPCLLSSISSRLGRSPHSILVQINSRVERVHLSGMTQRPVQTNTPLDAELPVANAVAG